MKQNNNNSANEKEDRKQVKEDTPQLTHSLSQHWCNSKWWIYQIDEIIWRFCLFGAIWFAYVDSIWASMCSRICYFIFCCAKFTKAINNFCAQFRLQIRCALCSYFSLLLLLCIDHILNKHIIALRLISFPSVMNYAV